MDESLKPIWIAPVCAGLVLLISIGCAWFQDRRDTKEFLRTRTIRLPTDTWLQTAVLIAAILLPLIAFSKLTGNGKGESQPVLALLLAVAALGCQAYMARRVQGRIEVGLGLVLGAMISLVAMVLSIHVLSD